MHSKRLRRATASFAVAAVALPATVGAGGAFSLTSMAVAEAETKPDITVPRRVRPGHSVRINVSGFPPGARVRVQFGVDFRPPANCCVSRLIPAPSRPGFELDQGGAGLLRVKMPRRYARCVSSACRKPKFKRWKPGQRIYVLVATDDYGSGEPDEAVARAISHVAR